MATKYLSPIGNGTTFFASDGTLLAGGKLYTYTAGSATARSTYKDNAGATAHANPIILDSRGEVTDNALFLDTDSGYKFVLKTSADATVWTIDNIAGVPNATALTFTEWTSEANAATYISASSFSLVGDQTTTYHPGRRLKFTSSGTKYGTILTSAFTTVTTITLLMDSAASLANPISALWYGVPSSSNSSVPALPVSVTAHTTHLSLPVPTYALTDADQDVTPPKGGARYYITPTAARTLEIQGTNLGIMDRVEVVNLATTAGLNVILTAEDTNRVWVVCPKNRGIIAPNSADPTVSTSWNVEDPGWPIHARVHKSADQTSVTESTATKVTFDTTLVDPAGMFSNANDRFVLPVAGWWEVVGRIHWSIPAAQYLSEATASIKLNGTTYYDAGRWRQPTAAGETDITCLAKARVQVTAPGTDYVELFGEYAHSGTNAGSIVSVPGTGNFTSAKSTWLEATYIGA